MGANFEFTGRRIVAIEETSGRKIIAETFTPRPPVAMSWGRSVEGKNIRRRRSQNRG
jgi:hypothetical protein